MDLGEHYLEVVLRFRRLAPSLVDDYVGPAGLAARVDAEPLGDHEDVGRAAQELRVLVARIETDPARAAWLEGQLAAIEVACRRLAGAPIGYRELVEHCHGVEAREVDESQFERAHELLAGALHGTGSLQERYTAWESRQLMTGRTETASGSRGPQTTGTGAFKSSGRRSISSCFAGSDK